MNSRRLLERFLRYVQIDTTAREGTGVYPSSPGQLELGRLVLAELRTMGLADAKQNEHGIVTATIPANAAQNDPPVVAFNAHFDTSPETTGAGVRPQVVANYAGGDLVLPGEPRQVLRVADNPELSAAIGKTIITTDGTTLLGGDDKGGLAVIMEMAEHLTEHPELPRPTVRICFTCDEEIGHGVDHVDLERLGATVCYTLDGRGTGEIDVETFSADLATVVVRGVNIHPSIAKGRMINAVRVAADFVARLPTRELAPEATADREGFIHPYHVEGGVAEVTMRIILRDFDTAALAIQVELLRAAATKSMAAFAGSSIDVNVIPQYRNMADGLACEARAVGYALRAYQRLGREPKLTIIRGGTDGSRFTELGLPTPNLSTGQHNPHSPLEWACLEEMVEATEILIELVQAWAAGERQNDDAINVSTESPAGRTRC
jgi:tripeptide aminopeptidase